ncbi:hypothetical protein ACFYT7_15135 [Streptomyces sp. NPDC004041]|uniref:hypothetical protein n=1 Tax=Streptomyces sp. NPDC004041 TaxID=3364688 RepID=UPI0036B58858
MSRKNSDETLRRISQKILSWSLTFIFGAVAAGLVAAGFSTGFAAGPLSGVAVSLGIVALTQRVSGSLTTLRTDSLVVINPLMTYTVPYADITRIGGGGTLNILTHSGHEINATSFGGSLIDNFVGSADRAVERIEARVRQHRSHASTAPMSKKFRVSWFADLCTLGAVVCGAAAGLVGT